MNELRVVQDVQDNPETHTTLATASSVPDVSLAKTGSMKRLTASSLVPYSRYGVQKIGHIGVVGLSLCIFSIVILLSAISPLKQQIVSQETALESARLAGRSEPGIDQGAGQIADVEEVVSQLPTRNDMPRIMGQIVTIAAAAGLSLDRGIYEFSGTESAAVSRYSLSLPVHGSYPQVRQFIENTLAAVPVAALETMRVQRGDVSDQVISADLEFTILVGSGL